MSKNQVEDNASEEKEVAGKATDDQNGQKKGNPGKKGGKDDTVLGDLNGEPNKKAE